MDPELQLLLAWRAGDRKAGDRLLVAYHKLIWRTVATKVPADAVEDLVQRIIVALLERRDDVESDLKFRSYAMAIARYMIFGYYREKHRRPLEIVDISERSVTDLGAGPSSIVLAREQERLLLEALRNLPLDDQLVLELHYWEHMTGPELGAVFQCLEPNIRSRLRRAKQRLETKLAELSRQHRVLAETVTTLDSWAAGLRNALEPHLRGRGG